MVSTACESGCYQKWTLTMLGLGVKTETLTGTTVKCFARRTIEQRVTDEINEID